ncbi:hypothetical protein LWI29_007777 [Acer saccharum]|uniref:Uncharacterized protein n=1 Tax=Acer saccharum TaxID=4024 RepID=A0AA39T1K8_ACESA|nr:hypothetical protein LWI29_007777 [Acer saccharum]
MTRMAERFNKGEFFTFNYTSLCRYPVYEADFGWGRPVWVAWGGLPYKNLTILMDTKSRDGIEAWIHLNEEDMTKFENDQELLNSPPDDFSFIYFFNLDCKLSNNDISNHLKTSLSKVLTHYYPLAGRVNDNYVDCNDEGVLFLEVQVSCQLSQILQESFLEVVNRFVPVPDGVSNLALAIQVSVFECGNVAICARMSHKIANASSFLTFIKNWAATARHLETYVICPEFVAAKVFPPKDDGGFDIYMGAAEKNIVLKRFKF